jgi:hypothetical protein
MAGEEQTSLVWTSPDARQTRQELLAALHPRVRPKRIGRLAGIQSAGSVRAPAGQLPERSKILSGPERPGFRVALQIGPAVIQANLDMTHQVLGDLVAAESACRDALRPR